jgi:anionic cell wall polymer biosynthesis LytR-Cps2A-Psr (LCP) family protein
VLQKKTKKIIFGSALAVCLAVALLIPMILGAIPKRTEEVSLPDVTARTEGGKDCFRFLLAGSDASTGLCDVLMLISIDRATHEVCVLQLPRDTYANYTEKSYRKSVSAAGETVTHYCILCAENLGIDSVKLVSAAVTVAVTRRACEIRFADTVVYECR